MMRTANPALGEKTFRDFERADVAYENVMTINGTVMRTGVLLLLLVCSAAYTWNLLYGATPQAAYPWAIGGALGGLVIAFILCWKKTWAGTLAPLYAVGKGLFLGAISALMERRYPGIVVQAVALTSGTLAALLVAYRSGLIKATENFKLGVFAATGGIMLFYLVSFVLGFFGIHIPYVHESGLIGIGFSLFVVVIAALNLVLDFDFIEKGAEVGAPKYMEWYAAFGLLVTLVWLYIEILRLLSKLKDR